MILDLVQFLLNFHNGRNGLVIEALAHDRQRIMQSLGLQL